MNLDVWNSLPSDIQQIIDDSIEPWSEEWMQWSFEQDQAGVQIAIDNGVQLIDPTSEELATIYGFYEEVALEVAADLDVQGLPGTEIFEAVRDRIEVHSEV
jgi:TRAP-type C4-dicarboxylate transport system substrate-binding protein